MPAIYQNNANFHEPALLDIANSMSACPSLNKRRGEMTRSLRKRILCKRWIVFSLFLYFFSALPCPAHTLFMAVVDNEDGTVTVTGMYSSGDVAASIRVLLETGEREIILSGKTNEDGEFTFTKPKEGKHEKNIIVHHRSCVSDRFSKHSHGPYPVDQPQRIVMPTRQGMLWFPSISAIRCPWTTC